MKLLGQGGELEHNPNCVLDPAHCLPRPDWEGLLHVLVRVRLPCPQLTSQDAQLPQPLHLPSTADNQIPRIRIETYQ